MTCYFFKLIPETGTPVYIDEPIKWSDVLIIGKRDPDWHGFNYEYTDGDVLLEFDCVAGKDLIEGIYNSQGSDGLILLQFGKYIDVTEEIEYEGKLNLATFKRVNNRIACSVEKNGLHDLVKSRWSTKVDLFSSKTLDGAPITPATPVNLELHSKRLVNNFDKISGVEGSTSWTPFSGQLNNVYFTFNTTSDNADNSNISEPGNTLLGVSPEDPTKFSKYVFDLKSGGNFVFNISLEYLYNFKLVKKLVSVDPKIGNWSLNHYLHVIDKNEVTKVKKAFDPPYSGNRDGQVLAASKIIFGSGPIRFEPSHKTAKVSLSNYPISLEPGDRVYIYAHLGVDGENAGWKGVESYIRTLNTNFDIEAETATSSTQTKAFLVHEALDTALKITTGPENSLSSFFLGREDLGYPLTGCGALNMITNGYQIRAFNIANKAPQLSLKDILTSFNALYCIGMGYEGNTMRVEHREYFYQDHEILFIPEVLDYEESAASELSYNNIEIGYSKYPDEGLKLLDEFNTRHEYLSPIRRHDSKFSQLSTLIGSGYAIELTRRAIYADTQKDSTKYDDDNFIIAVRKDPPLITSATFKASGDYFSISLSDASKLKKNDLIVVSWSAFNNKTFRVTKKLLGRIYVDKPLVNESAVVSILNLSKPYLTEKDEPFESQSITGVISPETSYNLRHSPKRMLMRWAKWLNGGFYYKNSGDIIQNTFYAKNGELATRFNAAEVCNLGDPQKDLVIEKADIALSEFDEFDKYYIPEWVTFKARVTKSQVDEIKLAMTGQSVDKKYGFIRSVTPEGNQLESWIYEMSYNPNTEQVSFKCLKKRLIVIDAPDPLVCSDYSNITIAESEALTSAEQDFIEGCRFDNFTS